MPTCPRRPRSLGVLALALAFSLSAGPLSERPLVAAAVAFGEADHDPTDADGPQRLGGQPFTYGVFGKLFLSQEQTQPATVAILLSGDDGWTARETALSSQITKLDTLVIGVDTRYYKRHLVVNRGGGCAYLAGSLQLLSRAVQEHLRLPSYKAPFLIGFAEGGEFAYAALLQAPANTFAGALSIAFCPSLELTWPLCGDVANAGPDGRSTLHGSTQLEQPWGTLSGELDAVCPAEPAAEFARHVRGAQSFSVPGVGHEFVEATQWTEALRSSLKALSTPSSSPEIQGSAALSGLPVIEIKAKEAAGNRLAVIYSGDGGWGGVDREVALALNGTRGVPVVGVDSLQYFWMKRTPEEASDDLARVLRHYLGVWKLSRVLLVGYSYGADVMASLARRLPSDLREKIDLVALIGPSKTAHFDARLESASSPGVGVFAEMGRLASLPLLCVMAQGENDSPCLLLRPPAGRVLRLEGRHNFAGRADELADDLLRAARTREAGATRKADSD
jgi:type IV secretory pathway VirJ component